MEMEPLDMPEKDLGQENPFNIPQTLQERIEQYNRNFDRITQALSPIESEGLLEQSAQKELQTEETKKMLAAALPLAVSTIIELCASASSESIKFRAAQFIVDSNLGADPSLQVEDPAMQLIKRLQAKTPVYAKGKEEKGMREAPPAPDDEGGDEGGDEE